MPLDGLGAFAPERLNGEEAVGGGSSPAKAGIVNPEVIRRYQRAIVAMRFEWLNKDRGGQVTEKNRRFTIRYPLSSEKEVVTFL